MAMPKYRFIPFTYIEEMAIQLASETPTRIEGFTYAYHLPELAEEVHQIVWKEVASITTYFIYEPRLQIRKGNDLENWAEVEEKVITSVAIPQLFRLKETVGCPLLTAFPSPNTTADVTLTVHSYGDQVSEK
jgi:hypothetical protein